MRIKIWFFQKKKRNTCGKLGTVGRLNKHPLNCFETFSQYEAREVWSLVVRIFNAWRSCENWGFSWFIDLNREILEEKRKKKKNNNKNYLSFWKWDVILKYKLKVILLLMLIELNIK